MTALANDMVTVCFALGDKKFIYPEAFMQFLTLKDESTQHEICKMLQQQKREKEAEQRCAQAKQEQLLNMSNLKITPNSQAAFDLKADTKAQVLLSWVISTGHYLSGSSKGSPRIPDRLKPNSACLLTECPKGMPEKSRRIVGVFMVQENFLGSNCKDGQIEGHERYRVALNEDETILFWDYFEKTDQLQRWGNTVFKYFTNENVLKILLDIRKLLYNSERQVIADEFYQYFCKINRFPFDAASDPAEEILAQ
ncbi:MAG: hypothetical protein RR276_06865 [Angelakisella sp.]